MRVMLTALALAGMLLLSGCSATLLPYAREMGDMALLRTMGVDAGEGDYQVEVTVSTGKRAYGLQGESQPSLVLSAQRESLSAACLAMQGLSDSYVFYGYVDQLLLGEELSKRGVWPVLDYFAQDVELGLVLLCKQAAKNFHTICKKETALKRVLSNLLSAVSLLRFKAVFSCGFRVPPGSGLYQSCAAGSVCIPAGQKYCSPRPRKSCPADRKTPGLPSRCIGHRW